MPAHNVSQNMFNAPLVVRDPGNGGTIAVDRYGSFVELVSAAAETRVLNAPTALGARFTMRMLTDGGDIVVTVSAGLNVAVNTTATFADVGDLIDLISVTAAAGGYRWEILANTGSVSLS